MRGTFRMGNAHAGDIGDLGADAVHVEPDVHAIGDSLLVAGPSGTGKSALATQFIAEGLRRGEPGIIAVFEERPEEYIRRAAQAPHEPYDFDRGGDTNGA